MLKNIFLIFLLLRSAQNKIVKITNLQCAAGNRSVCEITTCHFKPIRRGVSEMTVYVKLGEYPLSNLQVIVRVLRRGYHKNSKALYEYKLDICKFMQTKFQNVLADIFYRAFSLDTHSNFNHTCPYEHDIILKGSRIDSNFLSVLPIPHGEYSIYTNWYDNKIHITEVIIHIKVSD